MTTWQVRLPAEVHDAIGELVLALEALGVLADLGEGRSSRTSP